MPSPFPGMDPYLEGYLWPDVHSALAHKIRQTLAPKIQPKYVARIEISVVEDQNFEAEIGVMYPDVEIIKMKPEPPVDSLTSGKPVATNAPLTITIPQVRLTRVEIRDVAENKLVTSIEILSPVNKREPALSQYRVKRERLRAADVHLLEVDFLRRGQRVWHYRQIPDVSYIIALTRAGSNKLEVWPLTLRDSLPEVSVPLRYPDADVLLDLQAVLNAVFDEAFYQLSIDYSQDPPPPPLSEADRKWIETQIR